MVDSNSFAKMVSDEPIHIPHESNLLDNVAVKKRLHHCSPVVLGYSFSNKLWGWFDVNYFKEIEWDDSEPLMRHLALSHPKKELIESLLLVHQSKLVSDVIPNKSGGFVVLLYENPGTGKTLTAEAAAENRQCPLMIVSASELGYDLDKMESRFQKLLQICEAWNGILLVDEAEVYLENRTTGNIKRNAIGSVFLRLLEYHELLIFLTTNHINRIDPAIRARVAVAIEYTDLDKPAPASI
jgi:SpoVK/Ycf46/Vps4 family AAA+-type ATPase